MEEAAKIFKIGFADIKILKKVSKFSKQAGSTITLVVDKTGIQCSFKSEENLLCGVRIDGEKLHTFFCSRDEPFKVTLTNASLNNALPNSNTGIITFFVTEADSANMLAETYTESSSCVKKIPLMENHCQTEFDKVLDGFNFEDDLPCIKVTCSDIKKLKESSTPNNISYVTLEMSLSGILQATYWNSESLVQTGVTIEDKPRPSNFTYHRELGTEHQYYENFNKNHPDLGYQINDEQSLIDLETSQVKISKKGCEIFEILASTCPNNFLIPFYYSSDFKKILIMGNFGSYGDSYFVIGEDLQV